MEILNTSYTIITSDRQYIVESYNTYAFTELSEAQTFLNDLRETQEFDWIELFIIKIEKSIVNV